jgi:hypothetical protein
MGYISGSSPLGCTVIKFGDKLYHFSNEFTMDNGDPVIYPHKLKCVVTPVQYSAMVHCNNIVPLESVPAVVLELAISNLSEDGYSEWVDLEIPA